MGLTHLLFLYDESNTNIFQSYNHDGIIIYVINVIYSDNIEVVMPTALLPLWNRFEPCTVQKAIKLRALTDRKGDFRFLNDRRNVHALYYDHGEFMRTTYRICSSLRTVAPKRNGSTTRSTGGTTGVGRNRIIGDKFRDHLTSPKARWAYNTANCVSRRGKYYCLYIHTHRPCYGIVCPRSKSHYYAETVVRLLLLLLLGYKHIQTTTRNKYRGHNNTARRWRAA